jgi:hypothetical protein
MAFGFGGLDFVTECSGCYNKVSDWLTYKTLFFTVLESGKPKIMADFGAWVGLGIFHKGMNPIYGDIDLMT